MHVLLVFLSPCLRSSLLALALLPLPTFALALFYALLVLLALIDPIFGLYGRFCRFRCRSWCISPAASATPKVQCCWRWVHGRCTRWRIPSNRSSSDRHGGDNRLAVQVWLWGAFLWALLLALAFSPYSRAEAIKELLRWSEAFLIWLMVLALARRPWQIAGLIACLLLAPAAEALVGVAQFLTGNGPPSFRIAPTLPFVRAYGTIGQPNSFAGYMNMAWPLALALAVGATLALWQRRRSTTDSHRSADDRMRRHSQFSILNFQFPMGSWFLVLGSWFCCSCRP